MPAIQFSVPLDALLTVAAHTSTDESRPYIHGVLFEKAGPVVATNGISLAAYNAHQGPPNGDLVLTADWKKLKHAKGQRLDVHFRPTDEPNVWEATAFGRKEHVTVRATVADQPFPKWRQVVPKVDAAPVADFGLKNLAAAAAPFKGFGETAVQFYGHGKAAIVRSLDTPALLGLIYIRESKYSGAPWIPEWTHEAAS